MKKLGFSLIKLLAVASLLGGCGSANQSSNSTNQPAAPATQEAKPAAQPEAKPPESGNSDQVYVVSSIRGLSNTYYTNWIKGAKSFAASKGIDDEHFIVIENQGSSEKQMNDIKAVVARTKGNVVFNFDPNESADVVPIAKYLGEQNVPFVTWWNKPDNVHPSDYPTWAMHITFDNYTSGYKTAEELMKNMKTPYKGKIIAVQGLLGNTAAIERFKGFKDAVAKHPDVKVVSEQPADWSDTKAFSVVSNELVKTPDVDAIWAANDSMALGAIQALKAKGLAGKIPVTGVDGTPQMFEAIKQGTATATVISDSYLQGGLGLAVALAVKKGELKLEDLPKEKRAWMADAPLITKENVEKFNNDFYVNEPTYDWSIDHFFDKYLGPIK